MELRLYSSSISRNRRTVKGLQLRNKGQWYKMKDSGMGPMEYVSRGSHQSQTRYIMLPQYHKSWGNVPMRAVGLWPTQRACGA